MTVATDDTQSSAPTPSSRPHYGEERAWRLNTRANLRARPLRLDERVHLLPNSVLQQVGQYARSSRSSRSRYSRHPRAFKSGVVRHSTQTKWLDASVC